MEGSVEEGGVITEHGDAAPLRFRTVKVDIGEGGVSDKGFVANGRQGGGEVEGLQAAAVVEDLFRHGCDPLLQGGSGEIVAGDKGHIIQAHHTARHGHAGQTGLSESGLTDGSSGPGNLHIPQLRTLEESIGGNGAQAAGERNAVQAGAVSKSRISDTRHRAGQDHGLQIGTALKGAMPHALHPAVDDYRAHLGGVHTPGGLGDVVFGGVSLHGTGTGNIEGFGGLVVPPVKVLALGPVGIDGGIVCKHGGGCHPRTAFRCGEPSGEGIALPDRSGQGGEFTAGASPCGGGGDGAAVGLKGDGERLTDVGEEIEAVGIRLR